VWIWSAGPIFSSCAIPGSVDDATFAGPSRELLNKLISRKPHRPCASTRRLVVKGGLRRAGAATCIALGAAANRPCMPWRAQSANPDRSRPGRTT
jgi:hypothetical protein